MYQSRRRDDLIASDLIRCQECHRPVDEFTAIAERWGYWSDGWGTLAFLPGVR